MNMAKGEEERKEGEEGRDAREGITFDMWRGEKEEGAEEGEEEKKGTEVGDAGQMFMMLVCWVVVGERAMGNGASVVVRRGVVGEVVGIGEVCCFVGVNVMGKRVLVVMVDVAFVEVGVVAVFVPGVGFVVVVGFVEFKGLLMMTVTEGFEVEV